MLDIACMLHVDGRISANGENAANLDFAGGGAGGSIYVRAKHLEGAGSFEVGELKELHCLLCHAENFSAFVV